MFKRSSQTTIGLISAISAFFLWGFLPAYWKLIDSVPSPEILAHRFIWSFVFMAGILVLTKRVRSFRKEVQYITADRRKIAGVFLAAFIISLNWLIYIWAVNNNRIVETSLGYYITPLINVLLGVIVLKEKLSFWQAVSFCLALAGVLNIVLRVGVVPWSALALAVSFSLYGLTKKMLNIGALTSITLESLIVSPVAFFYLTYLHQQGGGSFLQSPVVSWLLVGAGAVTAIPMVLFSYGAINLPLSILGFVQYISPTIALVLGIFVYHETFSAAHLLSFGLIWLAITVFSLARTEPFLRMESRLLKKTDC